MVTLDKISRNPQDAPVMTSEDYSEFITPTQVIESTHPAIIEFTQRHCEGVDSVVEQAVTLYYAVRDGIRYNPYRIDLTILGMKASTTLLMKRGWCVSKAVLLAACCRSLGIPARLGFADVRNHLSTHQLWKRMGTNIFYWHGYTDMLLHDTWVKTTPIFDRWLCQKFHVVPLEFDGQHDSLLHAYDHEGRQHMEYIHHRGLYSDLPLKEIVHTFEEHYTLNRTRVASLRGDFEKGAEGISS